MKIRTLLFCLPLSLLSAAPKPFFPPPQPVKRFMTTSAEQVEIAYGGHRIRPADYDVRRSLNGTWKLSPLLTSATPFADDVDFKSSFMRTDFDDSAWMDFPVPLNWYTRLKVMQKPDEPYVLGWYRRHFTLGETDILNKQVLLEFERLGYEGVCFVNGMEIPRRHFGDFVSTILDITNYVHQGDNILAIRVRSDQGPSFGRKEKITHTYGSQWGPGNIKAGLWGDVTLHITSAIRFSKIQLVPHVADKTVEAFVEYAGQNPPAHDCKVVAFVTNARLGTPQTAIGRYEGEVHEDILVPLDNPQCWQPDYPQLYFFTILLTDGKEQVLTARTERFGFREFTIKDGKFHLNGQQIYLFGENIPSVSFGGSGRSPEEEEKAMGNFIAHVKSIGCNMIRTSHMPILEKALDIADEIGLMVFHEWSWSFSRNIDEIPFEATNLDEIARYVETSHNHPCVTMWSLGNEVFHGTIPEIGRQFNKQYDKVKACDRQKRPISIFSGAAGWTSYGRTPLKTDIHDLHNYVGLSHPWTNRDFDARSIYSGLLDIYKENNQLSRPLIAWENVGFSWSWINDMNFKDGNLEDYLKYTARQTTWGSPQGIGFSGCFPLAEALTVSNEVPMTLYSRRILELYRLDKNYQGFAPWSGFPKPPASTLWNQLVFPSIHNQKNFPPHHFYTGESTPWRIELVNSGTKSYKNLSLVVTLVQDGDEDCATIGKYDFASLPPHEHSVQDFTLTFPELPAGRYQMRLKLMHDNNIIAQNYYDVFAQSRTAVQAPVNAIRPVAIYNCGKQRNMMALTQLLNQLKINYTVVDNTDALPANGVLIVPPELDLHGISRPMAANFAEFARKGGFVLVFEQKTPSGRFPGLPTLTRYELTFSDIVLPHHPIFKGLDRHHFDTWDNGDKDFVVSYSYKPINDNVLAARGPRLGSNDIGMSVLEGLVGEGRVLCSQLNAFEALKHDSVAATYLHNVLEYACAAKSWYADTRPFIMRDTVNYSSIQSRTIQVDLRPYANRSFTDDKADDMEGGWTDQGDNDFRMMPLGRQTLGGIDFTIIDPAINQGKSCLVLAGTNAPKFPQAIKNIPLKGKYARLFFLHTAAWGEAKNVGSYRFHYADGKTETLPLVGNLNIGDWWRDTELSDAVIALKAFQEANNHRVYLFVTSWENPRPDVELTTFDFLSPLYREDESIDYLPTATGVPVLVAVTAEKANPDAYNLLGENFVRLAATNADHSKPEKPIVSVQENPLVLRGEFPAAAYSNNLSMFSFFKVNKEALDKDFSCLTLRIKCDQYQTITLNLPKDDWKASYSGKLQLIGDGLYHVYRIHLGQSGKKSLPFPFTQLRGELFFFCEQNAPGIRPPFTMEINKIILE